MANNLALYDNANWWNHNDGFHLLKKMNPGRFRYFDRFIKGWKDLVTLDVGCGGGFTCEFVAKRSAVVHGIDLSESSIEQAKAHAELEGLSIQYVCGSGLSLPYADNSFDVVTCVDVLEHIPSWGLAVAEIQRVLKPGGHFFFDTINRNFFSAFVLICLLENIFGLIPRGTHEARLFIKPSELQANLLQCEFSEIEMTGFSLLWLPWKRDYEALAFGPTTIMYIGHCIKKASSTKIVSPNPLPDFIAQK